MRNQPEVKERIDPRLPVAEAAEAEKEEEVEKEEEEVEKEEEEVEKEEEVDKDQTLVSTREQSMLKEILLSKESQEKIDPEVESQRMVMKKIDRMVPAEAEDPQKRNTGISQEDPLLNPRKEKHQLKRRRKKKRKRRKLRKSQLSPSRSSDILMRKSWPKRKERERRMPE